MQIDFNENRWELIKKNYSLWWEDKLNRPLIPIILTGKVPKREKPSTILLNQTTCHDLTVPADDLIDRIDYELSTYEYLGDAYPFVNFSSFGPGVVAAFLGASLDNSTGKVWFHPKEILPISELHFEYDADNVWLNRIKDIYKAGQKRWEGKVLMGMPDLGGILDILSTFRTTENLLMDLYDEPEEVHRLIWELHELWHRFYNEFNEILQPINPGYSDWSQIYSPKPTYVVQSDFSYMISPTLFDEFVLPELSETCKRLTNSIYHMDGIGELNHLPSILSINKLKAVQWLPGAGQPDQSNWPEIHKEIRSNGKLIQILNGLDCIDKVGEQLGSNTGIHHCHIYYPISDKAEVLKRLEKFNL